MNPDAVLDIFTECGALLEGHFTLSSGLHSPRYLQCALVLQHPGHAERLAAALAERWRDAGVESVVGPALGGIVVAYELARALGCRGLFMERQNGEMTLRRGFAIAPGEKVLVAEDVVTTGGSVAEIIEKLEAIGAEIVGVTSLIDRGGANRFADLGFEALVRLEVPTYDPADCPLCAEGLPVTKPGSRPGSG